MTIHVDKEKEWDPFVKKVMEKFKELDEKIELIKSNTAATVKTIDKFLKKVK